MVVNNILPLHPQYCATCSVCPLPTSFSSAPGTSAINSEKIITLHWNYLYCQSSCSPAAYMTLPFVLETSQGLEDQERESKYASKCSYSILSSHYFTLHVRYTELILTGIVGVQIWHFLLQRDAAKNRELQTLSSMQIWMVSNCTSSPCSFQHFITYIGWCTTHRRTFWDQRNRVLTRKKLKEGAQRANVRGMA